MKIFIPRIPKATTKNELRKLVAGQLAKKIRLPFTEKPVINSCEILCIEDAQGVVEHHGLVSISPENAGSWLLKNFKNQYLNNKQLFIREYIERSSSTSNFSKLDDRRRPNLKIEKLERPTVNLQAMADFARTHEDG